MEPGTPTGSERSITKYFALRSPGSQVPAPQRPAGPGGLAHFVLFELGMGSWAAPGLRSEISFKGASQFAIIERIFVCLLMNFWGRETGVLPPPRSRKVVASDCSGEFKVLHVPWYWIPSKGRRGSDRESVLALWKWKGCL